jgi:hypothetical protein
MRYQPAETRRPSFPAVPVVLCPNNERPNSAASDRFFSKGRGHVVPTCPPGQGPPHPHYWPNMNHTTLGATMTTQAFSLGAIGTGALLVHPVPNRVFIQMLPHLGGERKHPKAHLPAHLAAGLLAAAGADTLGRPHNPARLLHQTIWDGRNVAKSCDEFRRQWRPMASSNHISSSNWRLSE